MRRQGQGERFPSVPLLEPGGYQPFHASRASQPGAPKDAMMRGSTLFGYNPMDAQRASQRAMRNSLFAGPAPYNVTPGGRMGPGAWMISPDQRDRNTEHSRREIQREQKPPPRKYRHYRSGESRYA